MFLDNLLKSIGHFFAGLFNAAQKVWNKLSPELQAAMSQGSGIVAILNDNIGKPGSELLALIKAAYPALNEEQLKAGLDHAISYLAIGQDAVDPDLGTTLENIAKHLDAAQGTHWAQASHDIYLILAKIFAPEGSKFSVFVQLAEFVYHNFIKKR